MPLKDTAVLLTQWVEDRIEFNSGAGPQWVNRECMIEIHNAIVNRDWEPKGKSRDEILRGDWEFTQYEARGVTIKVSEKLMQQVQKLYKHGVFGRPLTVLEVARYGGLGEMNEVGVERFNEKHRKWREQFDPLYEKPK